MPKYDYKCNDCNFIMEVNHKMTETPEICCLTCSQPMRKMINVGIGLHFKGSGFYETDYKGK